VTEDEFSIPNSEDISPTDIEPGADLTGANLSGADLSGADLFDADLSGADIVNANFHRARLSSADLTGAELDHADLFAADLTNADLSGAELNHAGLLAADLFFANLTGATLAYANLSDTNLSHADLSGANFTGASLSGANLFHAKFADADLTGANLSHTDLDDRDRTFATTLPDEPTEEHRDRDLIDALQRLTTKVGESPRPEFVNAYGAYPADAYIDAFGSWEDTLGVSNLDSVDQAARARRQYTRTDVLDAVVDITTELGHLPSRAEMNSLGAVSSTTVENRFADWKTALGLAADAQTGQESGTDPARDDSSQPVGTPANTTEDPDILSEIQAELDDV
jgi:hypothetical protein